LKVEYTVCDSCSQDYYLDDRDPSVDWSSLPAVGLLREWIVRLASLLGMLVYFITESELEDGETARLTPTIWREFFHRIFDPLRTDCDRMRDYAEQAGVLDFDCSVPAAPPPRRRNPDTVTLICRICLERSAVVALRPCGHILCEQCAQQIRICPFCRAFVMGTLHLYL